MIHDPGLQPAKDKEVKHVVTSGDIVANGSQKHTHAGTAMLLSTSDSLVLAFSATSHTEI